ncbi:signal peptidase [Hamiltosporidium tvaerminnensis]|uniref:Signal peptidase complex catalytic subunit SEC11 n=2 Tax=Hamiltosporidium TaxID=1176354 RepID=A0A4Q9LK27_9MICR|nr:Signal peptidase complex catalytic subunit [Hamiltosporidium tvaerminnensis]TBT99156.1 signal peptidase [Hamiltosporidium tvaerminnensis]TBU06348.1 signal peptidase [Hamiltosporidium magnivora]TBU08599.1 signal peptidase [Hamiltosporidium magnivora]
MLDMVLSSKDIQSLKRMTVRQILLQFTSACYSIMSTYMVWKLFSIILNNDSPIVVVLSESMSPGFERGDILFLKPFDYTTGDMCVFQFDKKEIPIVHRAIKKFNTSVLTKGDNNRYDDVSLYRPGQRYLNKEDIISCVVGYIPYFGMVTIWANTFKWLKPVLMFSIGVMVFLSREE